MSKPKALIITVGAQGDQIIFSLNQLTPKFVGLLGTNTKDCRETINDILEKYKEIKPINQKILYCEDNPKEIGRLINNFYEIYNWLIKEEKIKPEEITVDPTGGRKWMSAGAIMISSFLGLNMVYVDVSYKGRELDRSTMKIVPIGNAYEQTGFLEEEKADGFFNKYNFSMASSIYNFLSEKMQDPRKVEIKKLISDGYFFWSNFYFIKSYECLERAIEKIKQYNIPIASVEQLKGQLDILENLKKNEQSDISYFKLLKDDNFVKNILLTLLAQSERFSENKQYDLATILLYRILELIVQYRLAKNEINTANISEKTRKEYNEEYKKITKEFFRAESEIPDRIGLIPGWILLYCLKDELLKKEEIGFLKGLRKYTEPRNQLWLEHANKTTSEGEYKNFRKYVIGVWLRKIVRNWEKEIHKHRFIKFSTS